MGAGRPTKYKDEYARIAESMCNLGATDADLADAFDVSIQTINTWKAKHPKFLESLKIPKEIADSRVEKSLYQRAMGYSHEDTDIRVIEGQIVQTPIIKHYPPDTTSMIFWLKNRQPDKWREKPEGTSSDDLAGAIGKLIDRLPG